MAIDSTSQNTPAQAEPTPAQAEPTPSAPGHDDWAARASALDSADPLAHFTQKFVRDENVVAYLDGNSLGRPTIDTVTEASRFVEQEWGSRLIRGWDDGWYMKPLTLADKLANITLGAAEGQTFIADTTTVNLYKLARAAIAARPGRTEIVTDRNNFPTDRYLIEGIAQETGCTIRWIDTDPAAGLTTEQLAATLTENTALVTFSHVQYRSGHIADVPALTQLTHNFGGLVLLDVSHSVGSVPIQLDEWQVDLAAGCTYKYLNGGPGAPAFGYVASRHHNKLKQPIQGWLGTQDPFAMGPKYEPHPGIRAFLSGTPPITAMHPIESMLKLIEEAGIDAIRTKSLALTDFALQLFDTKLAPLGVTLASPRNPQERGSHITIEHPAFREVNERLWRRGILPDYREPHGIRIGLSPLTTRYTEIEIGISAIAAELRAHN